MEGHVVWTFAPCGKLAAFVCLRSAAPAGETFASACVVIQLVMCGPVINYFFFTSKRREINETKEVNEVHMYIPLPPNPPQNKQTNKQPAPQKQQQKQQQTNPN